ncbi:preprotein translocase subunit SecG [Qipengyuania marisflavi]|uniref:Protein-export membrane protein SecG n=1 Tax=Qipengyuania marisflavi TaxID=2486356 RepID=A0A5S3P935_9SPHN|nr:preprotein translocase subunit SecG [Qipengyuania marisflavi]TMM49961.1 preprotein translocase subunit SecG [Qipengyuania marisflavi]
MFLFLTVLQAVVAAVLVGVILMQRSEGGGLGIGGSPSGMLSARGAADFLTRSTRWLAVAFVVLSIALAAVAVDSSSTDAIESTLDRSVAPAAPADPLAAPGQAPAEPVPSDDPLAEVAG